MASVDPTYARFADVDVRRSGRSDRRAQRSPEAISKSAKDASSWWVGKIHIVHRRRSLDVRMPIMEMTRGSGRPALRSKCATPENVLPVSSPDLRSKRDAVGLVVRREGALAGLIPDFSVPFSGLRADK
jgi:hypothetical protein